MTSNYLKKEMLFQRVEDVLRFALSNIRRLKNFKEDRDDIYTDSVKWSDKIIAETLLFALLLSRNESTGTLFSAPVQELCELIDPVARSSRNKMEVLKSPRLLLPFGFSHIVLKKLGFADPAFDHIIEQAIASGKVKACERISFREMDVNWGLFLFNEQPGLGNDSLLAQSIVTKEVSAIDMSREDAYAFTHTLFYATDFGEKDISSLTDLSRVAAIIDSCLAKYLLIEDLDLLGEFLICAVITRNTGSISYRAALSYFFSVWQQLGFLPSPSFVKDEYLKLEGDKAASYVYKNIYHTYYVGGILCLFLIRSGLEPNDAPASAVFCSQDELDVLANRCSEASEKAIGFIKDRFPEAGPGIHLLKEMAVHENGIREKLAYYLAEYPHLSSLTKRNGVYAAEYFNFILDCLLIKGVKENNLPFLYDLVLDFIQFGLKPDFVFTEILRYLLRQQLINGSLSGFFFMEDEVSPSTRLVFEYRMAATMHFASEYLRPAGAGFIRAEGVGSPFFSARFS